MANLSSVDKRILETLFNMSGGYVLDFSNRSFSEFFRDFTVDIYADKYEVGSGSKANRLRGFWQIENDALVAKVLNGLFEYIEAIKPQEAGGPVESSHRSIVKKLLGESEPSQEMKEEDFLHYDFGQLDLSKLSLDISLEVAINQRITEIRCCLASNAPLAAVLLCGSTLEGILLNSASKNQKLFNSAKAAPKTDGSVRNFPDWSLNDLINVAYEVDQISLDVKRFAHNLRDFRNYIHPFQQAHEKFSPDKHTAQIAWKVLQAAIADLSGQR